MTFIDLPATSSHRGDRRAGLSSSSSARPTSRRLSQRGVRIRVQTRPVTPPVLISTVMGDGLQDRRLFTRGIWKPRTWSTADFRPYMRSSGVAGRRRVRRSPRHPSGKNGGDLQAQPISKVSAVEGSASSALIVLLSTAASRPNTRDLRHAGIYEAVT